MTPNNIVNMAMLAGLQLIAVADHNSCRNCPAVAAVAEEVGLLAIPAMELTTQEEVHVLCLLPDLDRAAELSEYVRNRLPDLRNENRFFGPQQVMDAQDRVIGEEKRLLASASEIGVYEVAALLETLGGLAIPAHIDRSSFSLLSNLGLFDPAMGFTLAEVSFQGNRQDLRSQPGLKEIPFISNSDAHDLMSIRDASVYLEPEELTPAGIIAYLRQQKAATGSFW